MFVLIVLIWYGAGEPHVSNPAGCALIGRPDGCLSVSGEGSKPSSSVTVSSVEFNSIDACGLARDFVRTKTDTRLYGVRAECFPKG